MAQLVQIDLKVAMEQYRLRKKANKGKRIDNATLHAGSPMYFFCRFCDEPTETLPESYTSVPVTVCRPCEILRDHGLLPVRNKH